MSVCEKKYLLLHLEATHFRTTLQQQTWQWEKEIPPRDIPPDFRQDVIKFLSFHISLLCPVGRILTIILEKHLVRETFWWIFFYILRN